MAGQDWTRFLPKFKKQNTKRSKPAAPTSAQKQKKEYTPFPPEQQLRKEDYQMMSGEYFLTDKQKKDKIEKKREAKDR